MKNLRKLVPKEEIDALFKEVYNISTTEEYREEKKEKLNDKYRVFSYRVKRTFRENLLKYIPIDFTINDYSMLEKTVSTDKPLFSVGLDIEEKYRFFISVDEIFIKAVEEIFQKNNPFSEKNENNIHQHIEKVLEKTCLSIFESLPLKKKKVALSKPVFYEEEYICIQFSGKLENKIVNIYVSFDEILLDLAEFKTIIFSQPTTLGKRNLKELKEHTFVKIAFETEPIRISKRALKEGSEISIKDINIKRKYIV